MEENSNISSLKECHYCQSKIKFSEDFIICPSCSAFYHKECWYENEGCAVYGCNYRIKTENENYTKAFSSKELLIESEYLINRKKYPDAINKCIAVLNVEPDNLDAKLIYNRIVSLINIKLQLLEQADVAFLNKDFKTAEEYYKNSVKYLDDEEFAAVNSKLQVIKESIPKLRRKKKINNFITILIFAIILLTTGYFLYYYYFLQEERDFAVIEKSENTSDVDAMENEISKYERYVKKYSNGKFIDKAQDKIFYLSSTIIRKIYREDWKMAFTYLKKIDENSNPKTYNDLYKMIYEKAESEFKTFYSKAKKLDTQKKFIESKDELNKALNIADYFPESELSKEKSTLNISVNLINKKISYEKKINDIEKEINLKKEELRKIETNDKSSIIQINAEIIEEKSPTLYIAKDNKENKFIAIRVNSGKYYEGQQVYFDCLDKGMITLYDNNQNEILLPLYKVYEKNFGNELFSSNNYEKESILQRLSYLNEQKVRIDSILNLKL